MLRAVTVALMLVATSASAAPQDVKLPENWRETFIRYW